MFSGFEHMFLGFLLLLRCYPVLHLLWQKQKRPSIVVLQGSGVKAYPSIELFSKVNDLQSSGLPTAISATSSLERSRSYIYQRRSTWPSTVQADLVKYLHGAQPLASLCIQSVMHPSHTCSYLITYLQNHITSAVLSVSSSVSRSTICKGICNCISHPQHLHFRSPRYG